MQIEQEELNPIDSKSNLPKEILNVISLIFDLNLFKQQMQEFELDTEKLPLGKLSRAHIMNAYSVLKELEEVWYMNSEMTVQLYRRSSCS